MTARRRFLSITLAAIAAAGPSLAAIPLKGAERILFIGNSLTAIPRESGGLPGMLQTVLASATPPISVTDGACILRPGLR